MDFLKILQKLHILFRGLIHKTMALKKFKRIVLRVMIQANHCYEKFVQKYSDS